MLNAMRQDPKYKRLLAFCCAAILFGAVFAYHRNDVPKTAAKGPLPEADLFNVSESLFKRGPRDLEEVCLTFDDGPHPVASPVIMNVLNRYNVKATFFIVGKRLAAHPEHVLRMLEDGHEVANHTLSHRRMDLMSEDDVRSELEGCQREFEYTTGRTMTMMRPPGMRLSKTVLDVAKAMGYVTVGWNVGAKDYFLPANADAKTLDHDLDYEFKGSPTQVADLVLKQVKKGTIILLHENMTTARALPRIIKTLKKQGYKFRTVTQMLGDIPGAPRIQANPPKS